MDDEFLSYFERELTFMREMGREFAKKYPKIAGRLQLEPDKCEDPHTERLIESFAFLCARMHKRLDDDFPQITQSLLNVIYPHYTNPIPSMSVVQFAPLFKNIPENGYKLEKGTALFSRAVDGAACRFVTAYPVTLWPMEVVSATLGEPKRLVKGALQAICIRLKLHQDPALLNFHGRSLRFFLSGQRQQIFQLYELLSNNVCQVEWASVGKAVPSVIPLGGDAVTPVGFGDDEALLPYLRQSFPGYRLLLEYFCFPEKFLFVDVAAPLTGTDDFGPDAELTIYLDSAARSALSVGADTFRLHAAPVINTFQKLAEPIRIEHRKTEYLVIPDLRRMDAAEVLSVDAVTATLAASPAKSKEYQPLYSIRHHCEEADAPPDSSFWHMQRRPSGRSGDKGTEVYLSFCDLQSHPVDPVEETVNVRITCSNRDLPGKLPFGDPAGDFETEVAAPLRAISCLVKPTATLRTSLGGALQWRLISHLSLNYLSLVEGGEDALKEILKLYDFEDSPATRQQISGLVSLKVRDVTRRIGQAFCRGVEVTIDFDEDKFLGSSVYLFASVLERFLGQYVSINSFVQVVARTVQRKEILKKWPPRSGDRVLL